tara:strand:- start:973 stop:1248 length:276 start_codon:yes stop_codon:yes gene_type:complete
MKVIPLGKQMLVELDDSEKEVWGVILPTEKKEKTRFGTVRECGDLVTKFQKDDRIIVHNYVGDPLYINKLRWYRPDHRLIHEDHVPARIEE